MLNKFSLFSKRLPYQTYVRVVKLVTHLWPNTISKLGIQCILFWRSVNKFFFDSVKHVEFCVKKGEFYFTTLLKNTAAKVHRILVETYDGYALLDTTTILMLKMKNALVHRKGLKTMNRRHYIRHTHVRCKLKLQNH